MNLITRALTAVALFAGFAAHAQKPTERFLQSLVRNNDLTGIQVAFTKDGKTELYQAGLAREGSTRQMAATTLFRAGSLGKTVFAYAVMQLVDKGSITLDTPLLHYLGKYDRFVKGDARYARITARMVLSHTSGLADFSLYEPEGPVKLLADPGISWSYSGEGYWFLQKVVEKITGQPFEDMMQQLVFSPLGMSHSSYVQTPAMDTEVLGAEDKNLAFMNPNAAFSLIITAQDYAIFVNALMAGKGLKPATANEMLSVQSNPGRIGRDTSGAEKHIFWGLGVGLQNNQWGNALWHWGSLEDFYSYYFALPGYKETLVVMVRAKRGLRVIDQLINTYCGWQTTYAMRWLGLGYEQPGTMEAYFQFPSNKEREIRDRFKSLQAHHFKFAESDLVIYTDGLLHQRNYKKALVVTEQALLLFPNSIALMMRRAAAQEGSGDNGKSLALYEKALAADTANISAAMHVKALKAATTYKPDQLSAFAAKYVKAGVGDMYLQITATGNRLMLKQSWDGGTLEFYRIDELEFYNDDPGFTLRFEKDANGRISKAFVNTNLAWIRE